MAPIIARPDILSRVMFVESFSKSHGLCRERLGCYFSLNAGLFKALHVANISFSAGPGETKGNNLLLFFNLFLETRFSSLSFGFFFLLLDYQFQALGETVMNEESKQGIADLHNFWQKERAGLFYFLTGNFPYLFDEKQLHITQDDLESALGLYILLKTKVCIY